MKLLLVHPWAGVPTRQPLYARLQRQTQWEMRVITTARWTDDYGRTVTSRHTFEEWAEIVPLRVGLRGNIPLHFFLESLTKQLRDFNPDAIYVYHEPYAVATFQFLRANRRWRNVPVGVRSSQNILKSYPQPFRMMERRVYQWSDFCIVVSAAVQDVLRAKGYAKPIHVVPMAVDTSAFRPTIATNARSGETLRIGFVGRLVPEKGLDTVLRALAALPEGQASLTVVGDGPARETFRELADRLNVADRVTWRGAQTPPTMPTVYRGFDLLAVPSKTTSRWSEQFGRVVIEAAACGVPCVVSDSGELPTLVERLASGWIFPEGDHKALAQRLRKLWEGESDLRVAGDNARSRVDSWLSEEAVARSLATALHNGFSNARRFPHTARAGLELD